MRFKFYVHKIYQQMSQIFDTNIEPGSFQHF